MFRSKSSHHNNSTSSTEVCDTNNVTRGNVSDSPVFRGSNGLLRSSSSCNQSSRERQNENGGVNVNINVNNVMDNSRVCKPKRGSLWNLFRGKKSSSNDRQWEFPSPTNNNNRRCSRELCKAASTPNVFPQLGSIERPDCKSDETSDLGDSMPSTPVSTISSAGAGQVETPGLVGMHNLGNTCYFNAILQCLAHVDVFSEYFAMDNYIEDISSATLPAVKKSKNKSTPYNNNKGELTYMLAVMIKSLWHSDLYSIDVARELHEVIGYYERQYSGAEEHDAQEFLMWLINKVHEESVRAPRKKQKDLLKVRNLLNL